MARFHGDARRSAAAIADLIADLDHQQVVVPRTLKSGIDEMALRFWVMAEFVALLGGGTMVLAIIGVFGVVSFSVSRRTKELGIRLALGATRLNVVVLVVRSYVRSVLAGLATGLVLTIIGAVALTRIFANSQFSFNSADPLAYVLASLFLLMLAVGAMMGPAMRVVLKDPVRALRQE